MTEKQLAGMFQEARREDAILLLDEADGFLRDRREARASWEVTQVNELLTRMEEFEGVFICSTNLVESLDHASLRRFDFKIRFDYLGRSSPGACSGRYSGTAEIPCAPPDPGRSGWHVSAL